jgi:hypothetical protein
LELAALVDFKPLAALLLKDPIQFLDQLLQRVAVEVVIKVLLQEMLHLEVLVEALVKVVNLEQQEHLAKVLLEETTQEQLEAAAAVAPVL